MARKKTTREQALDNLQEPVLVGHETYDHVFYYEDDPDTLLNEDGVPVKINDEGEPIYDDDTGLPKLQKVRKAKTEKSAPSKPRKVRITPNLTQQSRLPLPGFMSFSRVMLDSGDFVRLMAWGRLTVTRLEPVHLDDVAKIVGKHPKAYQDKFVEFVKSHHDLGQRFPVTDFRLVQAVLSDDSITWAIAFPESISGKGLSLQKILQASLQKILQAVAKAPAKNKVAPPKKTPAKKSKPKSKKK